MVGRPVDLAVDRKPATPGEVLLEAQHMRVLNERENSPSTT